MESAPDKEVNVPPTTIPLAIALRAHTEVWLLGRPIEKLPPSRIPTKGDVLRYFFYLKDGSLKKEKFLNCNNVVVDKVLEALQAQWDKSGIDTQRKDKVKAKILALYKSYRALQKGKGTKSNEKKEVIFAQELTQYFFIAHADAHSKIQADRLRRPDQKEEDIKFLKALKDGEKVALGTKDKMYRNKVERKLSREREEQSRKDADEQRNKQRKVETDVPDASDTSSTATLTTAIDFNEFSSEDKIEVPKNPNTSDKDFQIPSCSGANPKRRPIVTLQLPRNPQKSPKITQMADRLKLSAGQSTAFMAAIASEGVFDLNEITLSKASTRNAGIKNRKNIAEEIKATFIPPRYCVLHWDGKIVPGDQERLGVLISGMPTCEEGKLLGVPVVPDGTGLTQSNTTYSLLYEWSLTNNVVGLSFDTTASNSGWINGACVNIETLLDKKVFYLACRHHIFERILCSVWRVLFGVTSSPDTPEFKEFQNSWDSITDRNKNFKTLNISNRQLKIRRNEVIQFLQEKLTISDRKGCLSRDDYRESAELMLTILGETPPRGLHWLKPGAYHHARWMPTIIYSAKMFAFGHQLGYNQEKMSKLQRMCMFNALFYIKPWLCAPIGVDAPFNDLKLWHELNSYRSIDPEVAAAAVEAMERLLVSCRGNSCVFVIFKSSV